METKKVEQRGGAFRGDTYKSVDYVRAECESLVHQASKAVPS